MKTTIPCGPSDQDSQNPPGRPVTVTQPWLPPLDDFIPYLQSIWDSRQLTNGGPLSRQLEAALCDHLGVQHLSVMSSGTTALMLALRCLDLQGEVITTPFSFVATAQALHWCGLEPVYVDIDPRTCNLDPARIEAAIGPRTTAILPVHCYGHPCDVDAIQAIAQRHGLRVLYDAAHAFGVPDAAGATLLRHGDLSVLSFHATKVFSTFEGGAVVCHDAATKQRLDRLRNFGIVDEATVAEPGLNGKLNEISAAFGLLQLRHVRAAIARNGEIDTRYRTGLAGVRGLQCLPRTAGGNAAYFPVRVGPDYPLSRDALQHQLREHGVLARRYFHPLLCDLPPQTASARREPLDEARRAAREVLCLPIHPGLEDVVVDRIVALLADS